MTLVQIMRMALRQLDEDPADLSEYDDMLRLYANEGYRLILTDYLKPREWLTLRVDEHGLCDIWGTGILRVVRVEYRHREVPFELTEHGKALRVMDNVGEEHDVYALCEMVYPPMVADTDEPRLPESAAAALVDYMCYRMLMNGNLAKQSRAQGYLSSFSNQVRRIQPDGFRSVTRFKGLYEETALR